MGLPDMKTDPDLAWGLFKRFGLGYVCLFKRFDWFVCSNASVYDLFVLFVCLSDRAQD